VHGLSMREAAVLERQACLGAEQVKEQADVQVALKFGALLGGQCVVLVLDSELVHPLAVALLEVEPENGAGGGGREWLVRLDAPAEDGCFTAGDEGFGNHG